MHGIRVLDLTRVLAGPWATQQLADQGATVLKVEPPDGDETRRFGPVVRGQSTYFLAANRNKRSICLDLKTPAGQEVLDRLAATCDVVVENFRPGVAERLGLGWPDLHRRHPRLIYVAIHAFGEGGPEAWTRRPGYDLALQAMGGIVAASGTAGGPPTKCATSIADLLAGLHAVQAVLLGLLHRHETGRGQKIVVNMMQSQAAALAYHATRYDVTGEIEVQRGNAHAGLVPYDIYRCADGWMAIACGNDAIWLRLRAALELPDEPGWRSNVDRVADRQRVDDAVKAAIAHRTTNDVDKTLAAAGVPAGPVLSLDRTLAHPVVQTVAVDHPILGEVNLPGPTITTATTVSEHRSPPALDADRAEILAEAGLSSDEVEHFTRGGAFPMEPR